MNKLYKYTLGLLTTFTLSFTCFSSAEYIENVLKYSGEITLDTNSIQSNQGVFENTRIGTLSIDDSYCLYLYDYNSSENLNIYIPNSYLYYYFNSNSMNFLKGTSKIPAFSPTGVLNSGILFCGNKYNIFDNMRSGLGGTFDSFRLFYYFSGTGGTASLKYKIFSVKYNSFDMCPTCPEQYTSLECQTEYNLIPVEDVNANYCNINFGMIDPRECPTTEGTGAINRTPRFINNEQYPGTNLLNINIPENIAHTVIYNEEETIVNVEGYNADENYINGILQNEKLQPNNKDFENMITGIVNFAPRLFICLIIYYLINRIKKIR